MCWDRTLEGVGSVAVLAVQGRGLVHLVASDPARGLIQTPPHGSDSEEHNSLAGSTI
jgi:hypothetical protein